MKGVAKMKLNDEIIDLDNDIDDLSKLARIIEGVEIQPVSADDDAVCI